MSDLVPISRITDREFNGLTWVDPRQLLINLQWVEANLPDNVSEKVHRLRTNELKELREAREAALFAYGISEQVLKVPTLIAKVEQRGFDFVMRWKVDHADHFYPVQLKELPPEDLNPDISLDDILDKLDMYSGANDLSVAIHINRHIRFEHQPWNRKTKPALSELWYFGCVSGVQPR